MPCSNTYFLIDKYTRINVVLNSILYYVTLYKHNKLSKEELQKLAEQELQKLKGYVNISPEKVLETIDFGNEINDIMYQLQELLIRGDRK